MYAPYTDLANFYIFSQQNHTEECPLVLVHCFAQIANPHSKEHWLHTAMDITGALGLNKHHNS